MHSRRGAENACDKALTFPDDALPPATSNAVSRGDRRHRTMQMTLHRVRSLERLRRLASRGISCAPSGRAMLVDESYLGRCPKLLSGRPLACGSDCGAPFAVFCPR